MQLRSNLNLCQRKQKTFYSLDLRKLVKSYTESLCGGMSYPGFLEADPVVWITRDIDCRNTRWEFGGSFYPTRVDLKRVCPLRIPDNINNLRICHLSQISEDIE